MLIGLSALAIGFTGSAGATYETNPTSNVVGAECSVVAAGVSTTAFNTSGDGKKSDGKLQVAVSGAPNAVVIEVLDPAGAQIHGVAVQHVDPAIQSQGYYFGVPVKIGRASCRERVCQSV